MGRARKEALGKGQGYLLARRGCSVEEKAQPRRAELPSNPSSAFSQMEKLGLWLLTSASFSHLYRKDCGGDDPEPPAGPVCKVL